MSASTSEMRAPLQPSTRQKRRVVGSARSAATLGWRQRLASRKLVEKLGFRNEGILRDNLRVGEAWRDEILFALLETDWRT